MATGSTVRSNVIEETIQRISTLPSDQVLRDVLKQLILIADTLTATKTFIPIGESYITSPIANTATPLVPSTLIASNFVVFNGGASASGDLSIGTLTVRPISISPGGDFLFNYALAGQHTDLSKWYISCPTVKQPYSVLVLADS